MGDLPPSTPVYAMKTEPAIDLRSTWTNDPSVMDEAMENLVDAIPSAPNPPMSTMEIWRSARAPKPSYTRSRDELRWLAAQDVGFCRIGRAQGSQFYRFEG